MFVFIKYVCALDNHCIINEMCKIETLCIPYQRWILASFNASAGLSMQNFLTLQFVGPQMTSSTTRRWNKDVDRSLYGSREYASKNPALSPITERLSFISQSPTAQETPSISCKGKEKKKKLPVCDLACGWRRYQCLDVKLYFSP